MTAKNSVKAIFPEARIIETSEQGRAVVVGDKVLTPSWNPEAASTKDAWRFALLAITEHAERGWRDRQLHPVAK